MIVGYARVSTEDQNLDLQIQALQALGCHQIYTDQGFSGALCERPGLDQALARLRPGGKLVVWKLDRLGRSVAHLVRLLDELAQRGVQFHSVTEHIDTSFSGGRLLFHFLSALAEFERTLISERTRAGMAAARAKGKSVGRPYRLTAAQVALVHHLVCVEHHTCLQVAKLMGVHQRTIERAVSRARRSMPEDAPPKDGPGPDSHEKAQENRGDQQDSVDASMSADEQDDQTITG